MQNTQVKQPKGSLRISQDVIATIACKAASEIEGVIPIDNMDNMGTIRSFVVKKGIHKPISINLSDDVAVIDMMIDLKEGTNIPEAAEKVQVSVKNAVQNMTGITVSKVNIQVAGIVFDEPLSTED
ncbi:MAG: Asp23/Gls24 family envelope stress response protein [Oscillospiraceae bacterium]|nr:Asp23/Gls24 family envelope stress response protein [Oscillospiraceae bacterium]